MQDCFTGDAVEKEHLKMVMETTNQCDKWGEKSPDYLFLFVFYKTKSCLLFGQARTTGVKHFLKPW